MFKAKITDAGLLTDSIATVAELIDEGIFKINKEGISMVAADRAMVAVVDLHIAAKAFAKPVNLDEPALERTRDWCEVKRHSGPRW